MDALTVVLESVGAVKPDFKAEQIRAKVDSFILISLAGIQEKCINLLNRQSGYVTIYLGNHVSRRSVNVKSTPLGSGWSVCDVEKEWLTSEVELE